MSALYDIIHPTTFWMVVKETQECADDTNHSYSTPSSAIPSGQLLKKVGELNMTHSLETGNALIIYASKQFLKLCDLQWFKVTASAYLK